ncbi:hypothetical protein, partial [Enterococcus faecium]|uniref:hypothetical protein n=1 Tax=Enterococcus faecium TaxID=1352 RepID=UPI00338F02FF
VIPPAIFFYYSTLFDSRFKTLQQNRITKHCVVRTFALLSKATKLEISFMMLRASCIHADIGSFDTINSPF